MNKETISRFASAYRAMKVIGISEYKVKPVLKNLLKLFDNDWRLIEVENYRALADAILDRDEQEAMDSSKTIENNEASEQPETEEEAQSTEVPEQPLKRLRLRYRGDQTSSKPSSSSLPKTSIVRPKEEPNEIPETHLPMTNGSQDIVDSPLPTAENITHQSNGKKKGKQLVSSKSFAVHENSDPSTPNGVSNSKPNNQSKTESRSQSHSMRLRDREPQTISHPKPSREKRPAPESSSHSVNLKEPRAESDIPLSSEKMNDSHAVIVPKDEPITGQTPCFVAPDVIVHSDPSRGGKSSGRHGKVRENRDPEPLVLESVTEKVTPNCTTTLDEPRNNAEQALTPSERSSNLVIASSPSGEVKFYLSYEMASSRSDFHMPTLESLLKSVEDKCLRSPKTSDLCLPMKDLMKEMCLCFLELGTDSNSHSPKAVDVTPTIDSSSKSKGLDTLGGAGVSCSTPSNGSVYYLTRSRASQTPKPVPPPKNDINHEQKKTESGDEVFTKILTRSRASQTPKPVPPPKNDINHEQKKTDYGDEILTNGEIRETCIKIRNDPRLDVVQMPQTAPEIISSLNPVIDIAKGQEKVVITLVNEVNDELPPSFFYIPQNASFQNAYVNISLARIADKNCCGDSCSGDCLSLSVPCACAHETGGDFAYTPDGLVKEELLKESISMNRDPTKHCLFYCKECPLERSKSDDIIERCKGHLVRRFIKECWWKCGCDKQCGNRVVQRGISRSLQVFMAPGGKGWGLRTLEDLPKGAFVCEYVGEVLTNAELFERVLRCPEGEKHSYPVLLDADWCAEGVLKDEEALCLDATYYGNVGRFINHRCYDSNLVEIPVEVESPDHHYYRLAFFTTRKVKAMEELTWDYGIDFDDTEHPIKAFNCRCGSRYCRNIKRSRNRGSRK